MIAKKVAEETLATIRNNKNIIAEEGKKISDMEEFIKLQFSRLKKYWHGFYCAICDR